LVEVRHICVHGQNLSAEIFDPLYFSNLLADGIAFFMRTEPFLPLSSVWQRAPRNEDKPGSHRLGQIFRKYESNPAEAAGDEINATFAQ
jgi:hypothetical protein